jgi:hypothetical protein
MTEFRDAAAERRKELAEMLLRGERVAVGQSGAIQPLSERVSGEAAITVPEGKLARSMYWYENDQDLLRGEMAGMAKFFPQFRPDRLSDGRMSWVGSVASGVPGSNRIWHLQATYDHDHPRAVGYGGSVKVVPIEPRLEDLQDTLGEAIPHVMRLGDDSLAICTVEEDSFVADYSDTEGYVDRADTAASSIARAVKWISAFELWILGEISTEDFDGHTI